MVQREWNGLIGLRATVVSLIVRSLFAGPLWAGATWLLLRFGSNYGLSVWLIVLVAAPAGAAVGAVLSRGLVERAGFAGPLVTGLAGAFAAAIVIVVTILIEQQTTPLGGGGRFLLCGVGIVAAAAVIVWCTVADA
jgi:hypothetical protein